jgi:AmmeMemoRadiSam system protein A
MKVMNSKAQQGSATERAAQSSDNHAAPTTTPVSEDEDDTLPTLARRAVETHVLEHRLYEPDPASLPPLLREPSACFVSIKTFERELRGCIGTLSPSRDTLAEEIVLNAVSAATRDPRFPPVSAEELTHLRYSVDVLDTPEPARFEDLDPAVFGVIVEEEAGPRRGLLLPDISGVETAQQQVQIAARKAGIAPHKPHRLYRFRVRRFSERARSQ